MKISKIFAAMSAAALAATMVAIPASAEEAAPTQKAYNIGFNIQFGHFNGGTVTATAVGDNLLGMSTDEAGALTCTGEKVDRQSMWVVNDWAGSVQNSFVEGIAIVDGGGGEANPGWNGMWIQCYASSIEEGLTVEFEISAEDGMWKDMDPADPEFGGWTVLVPAVDGVDKIVHMEAAEGTTQPSQKSFTFSITIPADVLASAAENGGTKPQVAEEEVAIPGGDDTSSAADESASDDSSSKTDDSKSDSKSDSKADSSSKASTTSTTTSKSSTTTTTKTSTTTTSKAASDATESSETGAAAGVGLAIAALAGAAIVVSRRK